ncbi:hypothetical protein HUG17_9382 [Dermatophagoides farinae]|uniref:Uncharacterized protein n=1 Tax=Dermatophagoides farinae TaxID=6954 RepID=A0A9D4NSR6_DERFA|nr:uncharacterized protein LOC124496924 [Dermatophagoides farinae]KAH7638276.1 hypothetical protein HUG17_9382 [Dermatophagoides farinae]
MSTTSTVNIVERDLQQLIKQARRLPTDDLEPCKDWTRQEMVRAQKLYEKINRMVIQSTPVISSDLFNEARECCNQLDLWINRLEQNLKSANHSTYHTLVDLGKANQSR